MSRLLLLVVLLAAFAHPDVRGRIVPHVKPHVERALTPVYRWSTRSRVSEVADALEAQRELGRPLPASGDLAEFVRRFYHSESAVSDPWGTPYYARRVGGSYQVGSAGQDRRVNTADDILSPPIATRR